eukprot:2466465-Prymnesium_polylepis.1
MAASSGVVRHACTWCAACVPRTSHGGGLGSDIWSGVTAPCPHGVKSESSRCPRARVYVSAWFVCVVENIL